MPSALVSELGSALGARFDLLHDCMEKGHVEFLLGRIHNGEKLHFDGDDGVGLGLFIFLTLAGVLDISGVLCLLSSTAYTHPSMAYLLGHFWHVLAFSLYHLGIALGENAYLSIRGCLNTKWLMRFRGESIFSRLLRG